MTGGRFDAADFSERELLSRYRLVGGPDDMEPLLRRVAAACQGDRELLETAISWSAALYLETPGADEKLLRTWSEPLDKLGEAVGAFNMAVALSAVPLVAHTHRKFGFDAGKLAETFSWYRVIIEAYRRLHGVPGVDHTRLFWFRNHVDGRLFRFGAMEFLRGPVPEYLPSDFVRTLAPDDEVPTFHYPGSASGLDPAPLKAAYAEAMAFWKRHFGHYPRAWASESWLFNPVWKELIPNSRIAHSTDIYEYICTLPPVEGETPGLYYVYSRDDVDPRTQPVTNSLQRAFCTIFDRGEKLVQGAVFVRCEGDRVLFQDALS